jgi:pyruvate/2-oxoglutarate dehydrogenase complex dihydrolipoamide acyltransferase (E2) component
MSDTRTTDTFREAPWPPLRNAILNALRLHRPHTVYGTGDIDVTDTLIRIRQLSREIGMAVSFHAFAISCLAKAASQHPEVHRYYYKNKFILFDDVDIATAIEMRVANQGRIPVQHCFRAADKKTLAQINWELRQTSRSDPTLDPNVRLRRRVAAYPGFVRRLIVWKLRRNPFWLKKFHGTMGITNLQRANFKNRFYAMPPNFFTLTIALGGITEESQRRMLCVGLGADHAVIDGGDIARFSETFAKLISSGHGLDDSFIEESRRLLRESRK